MFHTIDYTIRPYDTIWMLAQVFNTTVDAIMELNRGIDPRKLDIGQVIKIKPDYQKHAAVKGMAYSVYPMDMGNTGTTNGTRPTQRDNRGQSNQMPRNNQRQMNNQTPMNNGSQMNNQAPMNNGSQMNNQAPMNNGRPMNNQTPMNNGSQMNNQAPMNNGSPMNNQAPMNNGSPMNNQAPMNNSGDGYSWGEWYESGFMQDNPEMEQMADLTNYFRVLWLEHVLWTRLAVMGILNNLPETPQIVDRLMRNPADFAKALEVYYGEEAADQFMQLMTDHLTIAAELFQAEKEGNRTAYDDANQRWHENAEKIAEFLSSLNPYWHEDDWSAMMNEHLELLSDNVKQMIDGQYEESTNGFDNIEMQALEMADMMADGIMRQFSGFED